VLRHEHLRRREQVELGLEVLARRLRRVVLARVPVLDPAQDGDREQDRGRHRRRSRRLGDGAPLAPVEIERGDGRRPSRVRVARDESGAEERADEGGPGTSHDRDHECRHDQRVHRVRVGRREDGVVPERRPEHRRQREPRAAGQLQPPQEQDAEGAGGEHRGMRGDGDRGLALAELAPDEPEGRVPERVPELVGERVRRVLAEQPLQEAVVDDPVAGHLEHADRRDERRIGRGSGRRGRHPVASTRRPGRGARALRRRNVARQNHSCAKVPSPRRPIRKVARGCL